MGEKGIQSCLTILEGIGSDVEEAQAARSRADFRTRNPLLQKKAVNLLLAETHTGH